MPNMQIHGEFSYETVIAEICDLDWMRMTERETIHAAWAYYFFSVQFRENLTVARQIFPDDEKLKDLEREECNTDNLSPWPGVAQPGEKMNHDEFMRRVLMLSPLPDEQREAFVEIGDRYLAATRGMDAVSQALSITSYEDGGLERVFTAMLKSPATPDPLVRGFRHFLSEHIRFDSDPDGGHGSMVRHLRPDDRILPFWTAFRDILLAFAPGLADRQSGDAAPSRGSRAAQQEEIVPAF